MCQGASETAFSSPPSASVAQKAARAPVPDARAAPLPPVSIMPCNSQSCKNPPYVLVTSPTVTYIISIMQYKYFVLHQFD